MLVQYMEFHKKHTKKVTLPQFKKFDDLIITHFSTIGRYSCNFYYAIYGILIKLKSILNVQQKVEIKDEHLRRYFNYWLEICMKQIKFVSLI